MSTKIYYGKRVKAETLEDVRDIVSKIQLNLENWLEKTFKKKKFPYIEWLEISKEYDLELAVGYDKDTKAFYAIPLGLHGIIRDCVEIIPELEEFGYWDNSDEPEDVNEEEWSVRCDLWNRVCGSYKPIGEQMFVISIKPDISEMLHNKRLRSKEPII
jgi:hypothetical protein